MNNLWLFVFKKHKACGTYFLHVTLVSAILPFGFHLISHAIHSACHIGKPTFAFVCEIVDLQSLTFHQRVAFESVAHTEFAVFSLDYLK